MGSPNTGRSSVGLVIGPLRRRRRSPLLFRLTPASLPPGATFTRSTTATYVDTNGVYQTAGANALRSGHYIGGVQSILLEGSRTNSVLWSRDLTNAAWSTSGGSITSALNATGLDGTANSATTISDNDGVNLGYWNQTLTVPVDSNVHALSVYVRKDATSGRQVAVNLNITGGTTVQRVAWLNTQTGATSSSSIIGTTSSRVVDGGLWWIVEVTVTNNSTAANTTLTTRIYAAGGTVQGTFDGTVTGSCVVGQVQVELNAPFYSSPIFTTTATVTRGADSDVFPPPGTPQTSTYYIKRVLGGNGPILEIGTGLAGVSLLRIQDLNVANYWVDANATALNATNVATAVAGDTVESRFILYPDGSIQYRASVNGAAEVLSPRSAASGFMPTWTSTFKLNRAAGIDGFAAFQSIKIATGVQSLAEMRTL